MSGLLHISGPGVDRLVVEMLGLGLVVSMLVAARRWPVLVAVGYLGVMAFVPIWTGMSIKVFLQPQVAAALLVLLVAVPRARRLGTRLTSMDLLVALFFVGCLAPLLVGSSSSDYVFLAGVQYLSAYLAGRFLPLFVGQGRLLVVLTAVFSLVAMLALVEHLTHTNVFQSFPGSAAVHGQWSAIQIRGGVARAEGAFGHSIALGAALAVSMPLVLVAPLRLWVRLAAVVLMLAAVVVTFSRIALVTSCLGLLLSVVAGSELPRRLRALLVVAGAGVGAVAFPLVTQVFSAAGSEATNSAAYRLDLLSLVRYIDVLGSSSAFARAPDGSVSFGAFGSIDSALILQGLWYGWVSLAVALVLLAVAAAAVATRKATAPTIAIAAQIPALATVALITQYASMFWFVVGLAVCTQAARSRSTAAAGLPPTGEFASDQLTTGIACSGRPVGSRVTGERV